MSSKYLDSLSKEQRRELIGELLTIQNGKCFISDESIDIDIHWSDIDIDHVIPLSQGNTCTHFY